MRRRYLTVLILLLVASSATVVCAQAQSGADESGTISSTTELVLVPVQVKGHDGQPVRGLKAQDL